MNIETLQITTDDESKLTILIQELKNLQINIGNLKLSTLDITANYTGHSYSSISLQQLRALQYVQLRSHSPYNERLPVNLVGCTQLSDLRIDMVHLREYPSRADFSSLTGLKNFELFARNIPKEKHSDIYYSFDSLVNLEHLTVGHNEIDDLRIFNKKFIHLKTLTLLAAYIYQEQDEEDKSALLNHLKTQAFDGRFPQLESLEVWYSPDSTRHSIVLWGKFSPS